ncbi:MAG: hypothetical protein WCF23_23100 [Candidatus Nitrosopolaris sp.]
MSEKLKQLMNETQDHQRSFIEITNLYKEEKINEKDFFSKILNYVVTLSALTFLMNRVILELRSALEKGTSMKDASGGAASSASQTAGFGIGSFLSSVGTVGQEYSVPASQNKEALLSRKMEIGNPSTIPSKTCKECRAIIPIRAKFCGTCGNNQENDLLYPP